MGSTVHIQLLTQEVLPQSSEIMHMQATVLLHSHEYIPGKKTDDEGEGGGGGKKSLQLRAL